MNSRPWPRSAHIAGIFEPPPAAFQPEIVVLDLAKVGYVSFMHMNVQGEPLGF